MRALIDTIFNPVLTWLQSIIVAIDSLSIPFSRPLNISNYFGYFSLFGNGWVFFIKTVTTLAFMYGVTYIVVTQMGLFIKFKDMIKWW